VRSMAAFWSLARTLPGPCEIGRGPNTLVKIDVVSI
jgi:hypothetical protein